MAPDLTANFGYLYNVFCLYACGVFLKCRLNTVVKY